MTSIIKVDTLQKANGATPTAADLGINTTGNTLQTIYSEYATYGSSTSTSFFAMPLSATITPKFSNSKILVTVSLNGMYITGNGRVVTQELYKRIDGGSASSVHRFNSTAGYVNTGDEPSYGTYTNSYNYMETAGSTSSLLYQIYLQQNSSGTVYWNNYNVLNGDTKSTIVLQEIAG
tara:strand:+ start:920 stop:1450 length:531 start_codon:yes stop_codon:yes gene_type:complete